MIFLRFISSWIRSQYFKLMGYEILAPSKIVKHRQGECEVCPHRQEDTCGICKCLILSKTMLAAEKCPRNYWPAVFIPRKIK